MQNYTNMTLASPAGWKMRQDRARAKIERARDPERALIQRVRTGMASVESAALDAKADYAALHTPVPSPLPDHFHPHVAARLVAFLESEGITDPLAPLQGETLEQMIARYQERARLEAEEATDALRRHEVAKAEAVIEEAKAKLLAVQMAGLDPNKSANASVTLDDDDAVPIVEAKRPRGRPRVVEDEDETVLP